MVCCSERKVYAIGRNVTEAWVTKNVRFIVCFTVVKCEQDCISESLHRRRSITSHCILLSIHVKGMT
jgi:hypothetical protein